ncbi:MAG TPA: VOC family protein [Ktedonobacterales bacterium]|nr:VOC family protein [Ktedonobacterales bacterium]
MADKLDFVLLYVRDVAAERAFYIEKFGLEVEDENPAFVQFKAPGGAIFALIQGEHPTPTATIELWWQTADADATYARLKDRGVEIVSAPEDKPFGRALSIKDPEGNTLNFFQPPQG